MSREEILREDDIERIRRDFADEMRIVEEERDQKIQAGRGGLVFADAFATIRAEASIDVVMPDPEAVARRIAEIRQTAAEQIRVLETVRDARIANLKRERAVSGSSIELEDMGERWCLSFIAAGEQSLDRIVVIGGSAAFLSHLVLQHCSIVHLNQDKHKIERMKTVLAESLGEIPENLFFVHCDGEAALTGGFAFKETDLVVFFCRLHHLRDPIGVLARMKQVVPAGGVFIVDTTAELFADARKATAAQRDEIREALAEEDSSGLLQAMEKEWASDDGIDIECLRCIRALQLHNKESVASLLTVAGFSPEDLTYTLPCPCGSYLCRKTASYWFFPWYGDRVGPA
ncbi:MAG: methyltransferase domain-containing protein [Candidatus Sungbacteria bacterium]|nr:methyltransferase domain-containing protein [Candidatus Sungbacteria bacterium]